MGNFVSCTPMVSHPIMNKKPRNRSVTVIFPDGEVRQLKGLPTITAAELMFECPNFFLANSRSLHVGGRFSALEADEELEVGNLYIMFPMKRVKSVVTAADTAPLRLTGASSVAPGRVSAGIRNDQRDDVEFEHPESTHNEADWFSAAPDYKYRLSACRSRKPLLETITEEPVWSR